jgi:putative transposase
MSCQKALKPVKRRELVGYLVMAFHASKRRACAVMQCYSSVYYYQARRNSDTALRSRIKEIAATRVRYGYERIDVLLRREGWHVNHKKVLRIYREEGLNLRRNRPKRRVAAAHRLDRPQLNTVDQCWSMDFVADNLLDGKRIRALTIVDNFSRECLAIHVDYSIKGDHVVGVIDAVEQLHNRCPDRIQVDNGSEFISKALDKWAYEMLC